MVGRGEPTDKTTTSWRWDNTPLPEPHLVGIILSGALHLARPWRLPGCRVLLLPSSGPRKLGQCRQWCSALWSGSKVRWKSKLSSRGC